MTKVYGSDGEEKLYRYNDFNHESHCVRKFDLSVLQYCSRCGGKLMTPTEIVFRDMEVDDGSC